MDEPFEIITATSGIQIQEVRFLKNAIPLQPSP